MELSTISRRWYCSPALKKYVYGKQVSSVDIPKVREQMDVLRKKLNITEDDDWYHIKESNFTSNGFGDLLKTFPSNSPYKLVLAAYPEHNWDVQKFRYISPNDLFRYYFAIYIVSQLIL